MDTYNNLNKLKEFKSICLISHAEPDPDAFCSMVAFREFLISNFNIPKVNIYADCDTIPNLCKPILDNLPINLPNEKYECAIIMDAPTIDRLGKFKPLFYSAPFNAVIDHHNTNELNLDVTIVEETSSTCEIIYSIFKHFNYNPTKQTKGKLFAGLITDTNNFTVGKYGERSFQMASDYLTEINHKQIYNHFLSNTTYKEMTALATAIKNINTYYDNSLLFTYISDGEYESQNLTDEDCVIIINELNKITEANIVCFVRPRETGYYVSMRCKEGFNVANVAKTNGGGGHIGAAGFLTNQTIGEIESLIVEQFRDQVTKTTHKRINLF